MKWQYNFADAKLNEMSISSAQKNERNLEIAQKS